MVLEVVGGGGGGVFIFFWGGVAHADSTASSGPFLALSTRKAEAFGLEFLSCSQLEPLGFASVCTIPTPFQYCYCESPIFVGYPPLRKLIAWLF